MIRKIYAGHTYVGLIAGLFVVIIALTGFGLNYIPILNKISAKYLDSKPIPAVELNGPIQPGSLDQAIKILEKVMGSHPHMIHLDRGGIIRANGFKGDKVGTTLFIDTNTMKIVRVEDQSNSLRVLFFRLHDGTFFGSKWVSNLTALGLVLLVFTGIFLYLRKNDPKLNPKRAGNGGRTT